MTDELRNLIGRCAEGDQAAVAELVGRFGGRVFALCYRMLGHRQDAEDMAQETFVRALRSLHGFDRQRELEPWLLAIAGNRCRSLIARRRRLPRPVEVDERVADPSPDWHAERNLAEEVQRALATIQGKHREAFVLFHEHHLSYAEIAAALDCPLGTVKTWVHRARQELIGILCRRGVVEEPANAVRGI